MEFTRQNNLISEIVMVDAVGRSGKGMVAHILSSFDRVEKQHNLDIFEWVGILWRAGKISKDAAVTLLRSEGDTRLYNCFISRDVNFRLTDDTGVFKNADPVRYFKRLFAEGGEDAVERCMKENPIMQTCVHDGIRNAELFFAAFGERLKMIYIIRDPVYIIFEWLRSGFGKRIGMDPREFQLTVRWGDTVVPYTAIGWEDDYLSISPDDRVIALIKRHFEMNMENYLELDEGVREKILLVDFEAIVTDPMPQCERMASFLGTAKSSFTEEILRRENCPRVLSEEDRRQKIAYIQKKANRKYGDLLWEVNEKYASRYWEK